ncbi:MAG: aldo/keto reductase [Spirochaetota bacterium]
MSEFPLRTCGSRGLRVSALALGGAPLGASPAGPDADAATQDDAGARTLEVAWQEGIRHVDTSPLYGESERRIGIALGRSDFPALTISTKVGTHPSRQFSYTREDLRWSLGNSLSLLGVERVDVALIHDPPAMEPVLARRDGFDAVREMRDEGLCGNVGLGVQDHEFHRTAIERGLVDVILTYGDYNIVRRSALPLMRFAREHGVGVFLGSPQMHGLLASGEEPMERLRRDRRLLTWYTEDDFAVAQEWFEWCRDRDIGMRHLNMRFVMACEEADCVLTGAGNEGEVRENASEAATPVPDDVWAEAMERVARLDEREA